ncbi:MAG: type II secretion system protein M, partial [Deltaproteobacteria bacterium]|nr:type II secretion system protein M [Deltaproteobacteria bacterium]
MQFGIRHFLPHERAAAVWSRLRLACEPYIAPVREALAPYWQQAAQWYEKREPREKMLLRVLGGAVILLFIYNVIYLPAREWRDSLAERVATRQQQVIHLRSMMRSYERLRIQLASTQKRTVPGGKDPALFSALEMILTNSVGRAKIGSITPSEHQVPGGFEQYIVDVKLNEIALPQIVDTLYSLQT